MPWQMSPGDSKVVAAELHRVLSKPPKIEYAPKSTAAMSNVSGQWDLHLDFVLGSADHRLVFEQKGEDLAGSHFGELAEGDLSGWVEGSDVHFRSSQGWEGARFGFEFHGKVNGDSMSGDVDMGEYGPAKFRAARHNYRDGRPPARPIKNI
jgi:L-seryl-tRNA(Ser) seleniumtransferase